MKRILIVDDEPGFRLTMQDRLRAEGYETEFAADGAVGLTKMTKGDFDLALLDRMMPEKSGIDVLAEYRKGGGTKPVIMVTARSAVEDKVLGLTVGADDYLTKPFDFHELVARIEARLREAQALRATPSGDTEPVLHDLPDFDFGPFTLSFRRGSLSRDGAPLSLSLQEFKLLSFLCRHPDQVVESDTLLDRLWDYGEDVSSRTVYTHISWLRKKLKTPDRPDGFIGTVRGIGYIFTR